MFLSRPASLSALLGVAIGITASAASAEDPPQFLAMWGQLGTGPGEFQSSADVSIGASDVIYVADYGNGRIQRFLADGTFLDAWPTQPVDGAAVFPRSIAVDADDNVFVVAQALDRIQKYTVAGTLIVTWGGTGSADGQFRFPSGIAIGPNGNVYVADSNNFRIQEFTGTGAHVRTIGPLSTPPVSLGLVGGVGVDASGNIFTSDVNGDRIVKLAPTGEFLLQWGTTGSADGAFDSPGDLCVDAAGSVYVVEQVFPPFQPCNHRAQKFDNDGGFLSGWGGLGTAPGQFDDPHGIAVDPMGHVYVADTQNDRVQKFGEDATVAVVLSGFEAVLQSAGVEIRWRAGLTADATFGIWRAAGSETGFGRIGEVTGRRGEQDFSFLDTSARPLASYSYKLSVQQDGEVTFTEALHVETAAASAFRLAVGPNPSRGGVRVDYSMSHGDRVQLDVFDVAGARVRTLVDRTALPGTASLWWNGLDEDGRLVAAGRYYVRLVVNGSSRTQSIVLLR